MVAKSARGVGGGSIARGDVVGGREVLGLVEALHAPPGQCTELSVLAWREC